MDHAGRTSLGLLLMLGFTLIAPLMDTLAKLIGNGVAVAQIGAVRFAFQTALLLPVAAVMGWLHCPDRAEVALHLARSAILLVATTFFFKAVQLMPIADAITIFFIEPFLLVLLGALLLGEKIGPRRYIACAIGFAGALLVIQPSFQNIGYAAFLPVVAAFMFAFYMILTRKMAMRMHPVTLQAYTGLAALLIVIPVLWAFDGSGVGPLDPAWPSARDVKLLLALAVVATLSHVCLSFALSLAPASTLAPLHYLEIISATILGYYIFDDLPDALTFVGIALIVFSGLYVFVRERQLQRRLTQAL